MKTASSPSGEGLSQAVNRLLNLGGDRRGGVGSGGVGGGMGGHAVSFLTGENPILINHWVG
ncbi:hypothetical protein I553_8374 [Mycobacterium xenopi 4042]|uniref:Uncharacterized protein n=1 Tax=Mycobacterium xenopi 4042 TaxID=1299334 RepID=X8BLU9_MYCXE|nr:hypothetical protein I553_8374 [Mycobacterium xenopi 4042]